MARAMLQDSPNAGINKSLLSRYMDLPLPANTVQAEYIWVNGSGETVLSKSRTLDFIPKSPQELPTWDAANFYAGVYYSVNLCPVAIYRDPFTRGNNKLILCETYNPDNTPFRSNNRCKANEAMKVVKHHEPWFGIEQEYSFLDYDRTPLGWPKNGYPGPHGPYHFGVGADVTIGREIVQAHYRACLYAGVKMAGTNSEAMLSQWEFQVGPCDGISVGDDLWMARFILHRIAEEYGVVVTLDPKPFGESFHGTGAHTNFSTKAMRADGGIKEIEKAIDLLSKTHPRHIQAYDPHEGKDNERRLTGKCETAGIDDFVSTVDNKNASIRIPRRVAADKKGYFEDRRPSSNCDPYSVIDAIVRTCLLHE